MNQQQLINIIAMMALFGLVFSVWCICILLWFGKYVSRLRSVQGRLGIVKKETEETHTLRLWRETQQNAVTGLSKQKLNLQEKLERLRNATRWSMPVHTVILGVFVAALLSSAGLYLWKGRLTWSVGVFVAVIV